MALDTLRYDDSRMRGNLSAAQRVSPSAVSDARRDVLESDRRGEQGWLRIVDDADHLLAIKNTIKQIGPQKNCLVLGIGGSDLGARALLAALRLNGKKTKIWFAGDTTDPEELADVFSKVPWKQTCINVISKSGGTLETMAAFFLAREQLEKAVGAKKAATRIICTTDPQNGDLHDLAVKKGYAILPIPHNIGGRFSILTAVGLFPLALAGVNLPRLLAGASEMRKDWEESVGAGHAVDKFAAWHVAHDQARRPIHVLMPYASALTPLASWWRQLWAESLGKSVKRNGARHYDGPTPVIFSGPTDQHSQLQLYQQGPDDKVYTFLTTDAFRTDAKVPKIVASFDAVSYAAGRKFSELIAAEVLGSAEALVDAGRPVGILSIKKIDEYSLGSLVMFFELATAVAGALYNINTFDQPGVEASKHKVHDILTGKGIASAPIENVL